MRCRPPRLLPWAVQHQHIICHCIDCLTEALLLSFHLFRHHLTVSHTSFCQRALRVHAKRFGSRIGCLYHMIKMSYSSRTTSAMQVSPASPSRPIQQRSATSGTLRTIDLGRSSTQSGQYSSCAFPSWPSGSAFQGFSSRRPSAHVSDEDLFGDDDVVPLREAPPPPRPAEMWAWAAAQPVLPFAARTRRRRPSAMPRKESNSSASKT